MARRAGKAASRKARQRKLQRGPGVQPSRPAAAPDAEAESVTPPPTASSPPRQRVEVVAATGSQLSASERGEYHYVERDLRDIGILGAVMAALLFLAWLAFSAIGITG